jgi:hypothetical protein
MGVGSSAHSVFRWRRYQLLAFALSGGFTLLCFVVWLGLTLAGKKAGISTKDGGETPIWMLGVAVLVTFAI